MYVTSGLSLSSGLQQPSLPTRLYMTPDTCWRPTVIRFPRFWGQILSHSTCIQDIQHARTQKAFLLGLLGPRLDPKRQLMDNTQAFWRLAGTETLSPHRYSIQRYVASRDSGHIDFKSSRSQPRWETFLKELQYWTNWAVYWDYIMLSTPWHEQFPFPGIQVGVPQRPEPKLTDLQLGWNIVPCTRERRTLCIGIPKLTVTGLK